MLAVRNAAARGWHGPAATAFDASAHGARTRVDELVGTTGSTVRPLLTYADELQRLQTEFVRIQIEWRNLGGTLRVTPGTAPELPGLQDAAARAEARLREIIAEAAQANATASDELSKVIDTLTERDRAAERLALTVVSAGLGQKAEVGREFFDGIKKPHVADRITWAGRALAPITTVVSQLVEDSGNPHYSIAERIGRAVGKGISTESPRVLPG